VANQFEYEDVHMMILLPDAASLAAFKAEDAELFSAAAAAASASHDSASSVGGGGGGEGASAEANGASAPAPAPIDPLAVGVTDDVVVEMNLAGAHVRCNPEANARVHGPHATPDEILTGGSTAARPPPEFQPLHQLLQARPAQAALAD